MNPIYFREIEVPYIREILAERFDNFAELMTEGSVVFGGAIRDIIAGVSMNGDLDIAVDPRNFKFIVDNFRYSPKWTLVYKDEEGRPRPQKPSIKSGKPSKYKGIGLKLKKVNKYPESMKIGGVITFCTIDNIKVQIISAKGMESKSLYSAMDVARNVDLRCCALCMDTNGVVYEVVEGAEEDCLNRRLNICKLEAIDFKRTEARIRKLTRRGWSSDINMDKLRADLKKIEVARKKEAPKNTDDRKFFQRILRLKAKNITKDDVLFVIPEEIIKHPLWFDNLELHSIHKEFHIELGIATSIHFESRCIKLVFKSVPNGRRFLKRIYNILMIKMREGNIKQKKVDFDPNQEFDHYQVSSDSKGGIVIEKHPADLVINGGNFFDAAHELYVNDFDSVPEEVDSSPEEVELPNYPEEQAIGIPSAEDYFKMEKLVAKKAKELKKNNP